MFERFTDRSRRVVVLAQEEALELGHARIGTEHLLLGLLREDDGPARRVLDALGVTLGPVREEIRTIVPAAEQAPTGQVPFTPGAKRVLELSLREALQLGHDDIGTEHILLGVVREGEGIGAQVLVGAGADVDRVRQEVIGQTVDALGPASIWPRRRATPGDVGWPLSEWDPSTGGAFYAVMSRPAGLVGRLQTAVGMDSGVVRQVLSSWLARAPAIPAADGEVDCSYFSARVEEGSEGAFVVTDFAYGESGPEDWPRKPLADLLAFAVEDLRVHRD